MPAYFSLHLDTKAPAITWGPIQGNVPGGRLTIFYSVDETGIADAVLQSVDGLTIPLNVEADHLWVNLPESHPSSIGMLVARTRDEVDNEAFYSLSVGATEDREGFAESDVRSPFATLSELSALYTVAIDQLEKRARVSLGRQGEASVEVDSPSGVSITIEKV